MLNKSISPRFVKNLPIEYITNILSVYLCSFLVVIGIIGNLIVLGKFLRYNVKTANILTKKIIILLTISNSIYLLLFSYVSIVPKIIIHFKLNTPVNNTYSNATSTSYNKTDLSQNLILQFYRINSSVFLCKLISYMISVSIFMNSSITVIFSLERALAINFPFKMRNLREKRRSFFNVAFLLVIIYSILFPSYNLVIANLVKYKSENFNQLKCDIPIQYESFYFNFTIAFVVQTLGLPFCLVTLSNISILIAIERNRKNLLNSKFRKNSGSNVETRKNSISLDRFYYFNQTKKTKQNSDRDLNGAKLKTDSCKSGSDPTRLMRIRKKFFVISASFVLLNFPYFLAWNKYAFYRMNVSKSNKDLKLEEKIALSELFSLVKLTEVLNLCNYAITGFLYFTVRKFNFRSPVKCRLRP